MPLSRQAMDLLRSRLPIGADGNLKRPDPDALVFSTSTGATLGNWDREDEGAARDQRHRGMDVRHDLRRTGATMLGEMGNCRTSSKRARTTSASRSPLAATATIEAAIGRRLQQHCNVWQMCWMTEAGTAKAVPLRAQELTA